MRRSRAILTTAALTVATLLPSGVGGAANTAASVAPPGSTPTLTGDVPVVGDWNGDGTTTIGVRRGDTFHLRNTNTAGPADVAVTFGNVDDVPLAGDWNGDGTTTIGVWRNGTFYLRNTNTSGAADVIVTFGNPDDVPLAGDWNGDGTTTIGVWRNGTFFLRNTNTAGVPDATVLYGNPTDIPVVGDWDGNGTVTVGVSRIGRFYLRNTNTSGAADSAATFGNNGDVPVAGDWDGNGSDTVGVRRVTIFYLRNTNTTGNADLTVPFGAPTVVNPGAGQFSLIDKKSSDFPNGSGGTALLRDVRVGDNVGFERIVFEFQTPNVPSYFVRYVTEISGPSGIPVNPPGSAKLAVTMSFASGFDQNAIPPAKTYNGPLAFTPPDAELVAGVAEYEDFEATLGWVIGLNGQLPFAVFTLQNPSRLVIDVQG